MFVTNCWYVVAWDTELKTDQILSRTILNKPLVLFQTGEQTVVMDDRCCHRHAPLSKGRLEDDGIRCMYHGLKFGADGRCIEIPGQDRIPDSMRVATYPTVVQDGFVWCWFGDPERADVDQILRYPVHLDDAWRYRKSYSHVNANYKLLVDNTLDFTHIAWCHQGTFGTMGASSVAPEIERHEAALQLTYRYLGTPLTPFHQKLTGWQGTVDRTHIINWTAPCFLQVQAKFVPTDAANYHKGHTGPMGIRSSHAFTPETEHSTHYFWTHANQKELGSEDDLDLTYDVVRRGFEDEDIPIIEAQQAAITREPEVRMHATQYDEAPTLARQIIKRMETQTL